MAIFFWVQRQIASHLALLVEFNENWKQYFGLHTSMIPMVVITSLSLSHPRPWDCEHRQAQFLRVGKGGGSMKIPGMFLRTGGHVPKFAAWKFFLVTRVMLQRAWVAAWRFWAVTCYTCFPYVGRPHDSAFLSPPEAAGSLSLVTWMNGQTSLGAG